MKFMKTILIWLLEYLNKYSEILAETDISIWFLRKIVHFKTYILQNLTTF